MKPKPRISILNWVILLPLILITAKANSQIVLTLTPSYYGATHNISCFGKNDGYINMAISGGATPYTFRWSNNATTQNLTTLPAGYYSVVATDRNGVTKSSEITLVEPRDLGLSVTPYSYPNGYNISLFGSCNGMVTVTTTDGVPPYTYLWSDGSTNQNRTSMCKGSYGLVVTDANNCKITQDIVSMIEPERSDWTMTGNAGSNPVTQFIGTSDSTALKFRTNNQERIKIGSDGTISIPGFSGGIGMLYVDSNGVLNTSRTLPNTSPCSATQVITPIWRVFKPNLLYTCQEIKVAIGTDNIPSNVNFKVNGTSWLDGMVTIGIDPNAVSLAAGATNYKLIVNGKIGANEIYCSTGSPSWPDYVFESSYKQKSLTEIEKYLAQNKHLPGIPTATEIETDGLPLAKMQSLQMEKIEEIYLYLIKLEKDNLELRKQIEILKKSK